MPTTTTRKPREFILTLNEVKRKDGVVSVRMFGEVECLYPLCDFLRFLGQPHVDESLGGHTLLMSECR